MRAKRVSFCAILSILICAGAALAQVQKTACESTAPPKYLLLVHVEFQPGKSAARLKLETEISRNADSLNLPLCWIEMEALTGTSGALYVDPFESFQRVEQAGSQWADTVAKHAEMARLQQGFEELITSSKTVIAARRDDLGYRVDRIDLSKMRFVRVVVVRVREGHENEFAEAFKAVATAYEETNSPGSWMVYGVDSGIPRPTFLVMVPMRSLEELDKLIANAAGVHAAEGDPGVKRLQEIAREAYLSSEVQLYAVSPQMSHVSPAFAAGDPAYWVQKPLPPPPSKKKQ